MSTHILTLNAGSSSIKFSLVDTGAARMAMRVVGKVEGIGGRPKFQVEDNEGISRADRDLSASEARDQEAALATILQYLRKEVLGAEVAAIGHRVVHGGLGFDGPVLIDDAVLAAIEALTPWAPLHQPHCVAGIRAARGAFPDAPQVACFDTAFHRGHAFENDAYALPRALYDEGVRRYGFHGLSYEYVSRRLREIAPDAAAGRVIVAHLGNGASMCALRNGKSVASTMGFSTLDGLPMGTRPGQLDPGVLLFLTTAKGLDANALTDLLYKQSGLEGLSGVSNDMRELEASQSPRAREAIGYFVHRIRYEIGGLAATLGGLDALVFCAGIGEHSATIRKAVLDGMGWLGLACDEARNLAHATVVSSDSARVRVFVIPTNEELMIAEQTAAVGLRHGRQIGC
jgi:acetate kinase